MVLPELVTATISERDRQAAEMLRQREAIAQVSSEQGPNGDPPGGPPLLRRIPLIGSFAR